MTRWSSRRGQKLTAFFKTYGVQNKVKLVHVRLLIFLSTAHIPFWQAPWFFDCSNHPACDPEAHTVFHTPHESIGHSQRSQQRATLTTSMLFMTAGDSLMAALFQGVEQIPRALR